jgi:hypothetical protein
VAALTNKVNAATRQAMETSSNFPNTPPQFIPQFVGIDAQSQRRLQFKLRNTGARVPPLFVAPGAAVTGDSLPMASPASGVDRATLPVDANDPNFRAILLQLVREVLISLGYSTGETTKSGARKPNEWDKARRERSGWVPRDTSDGWYDFVPYFCGSADMRATGYHMRVMAYHFQARYL